MGQKFTSKALEATYRRHCTGVVGMLTRKQLKQLAALKPKKVRKHIGRRAFQAASRISFWESTPDNVVKFNY